MSLVGFKAQNHEVVTLVTPPVPEAHALTIFRCLSTGEGRAYTATWFPNDPWQGCEHFVRTAAAVGYLRDSGVEDAYAVMDVLNANGDIVQDYVIPSAPGFRFVKRKLQLAVEPVEPLPAFSTGEQ